MFNGEWSDFVSDFMALTEGVPSPEIFRRWSAIAAVAGALERRVWVRTGQKTAFANLYTLLVAPPAVGKYVIEEVRQLWTETREPDSKLAAFHVAPDNMTKASLMDTLAKAKAIRLVPAGPALTYHSLLIAAEEFQVLLPVFDQEYIGALNSIYNNKTRHEEARRHGPARELSIDFPQLNILGGAQPSYFVSTFPEEAWTTGFARRIIMVYAGDAPFQELFYDPEIEQGLRKQILAKLAHISQLYGPMLWTPAAAEGIASWHKKGGPPAPTHSKLVHYNRARSLHATKLAMISAISRTGALIIDTLDVSRAISWLVEAERLMPDIFREMIGKSDSQVIEEMHYFVQATWARQKQKAVLGADIMRFLLTRVPSDKAEKIMMMSEKADVIARVAGTNDLYVPRPRYDHKGVE